jgi:hypothetical protein
MSVYSVTVPLGGLVIEMILRRFGWPLSGKVTGTVQRGAESLRRFRAKLLFPCASCDIRLLLGEEIDGGGRSLAPLWARQAAANGMPSKHADRGRGRTWGPADGTRID